MSGIDEIDNCDAIRFAKKPSNLTGITIQSNHPESLLLVEDGETPPNPKTLKELERRLECALLDPENNEPILNWYSERPGYWFRHATPPVSPLLFNYYIRNNPRFILNLENIPYADNYYGLTPNSTKPIEFFFALLNSSTVILELLTRSRRQGNGLKKLQLFELRECWVPAERFFDDDAVSIMTELGQELVAMNKISSNLIERIDNTIFESLGRIESLNPKALTEQIENLLEGPRWGG